MRDADLPHLVRQGGTHEVSDGDAFMHRCAVNGISERRWGLCGDLGVERDVDGGDLFHDSNVPPETPALKRVKRPKRPRYG